MRGLAVAMLIVWVSGCRTVETYPAVAVPEGKDPFYCRHVSCAGLPVMSSDMVPYYGLKEAAYLIDQMLATRPDVRQAMIESGMHMTVMGHAEFTTDVPEYAYLRPKHYWDRRARGLGPTKNHPVVSTGVENLLQYPGDPYYQESILVHEFAHAIHHYGLNLVDPEFDDKLNQIYKAAMAQGLWKGKYAATNRAEYWAEGVQSYFGNNRPPDHDHNHVDTRAELFEYDPALAKLIDTAFAGSDWQFVWPSERRKPGHLRGYDRERAPTFEWPAHLLGKWWENRPEGYLKAQPADLKGVLSKRRGPSTLVELCLVNNSGKTRDVYWVNFEGKPEKRQRVRQGGIFTVRTYVGHPWLVTDEAGKGLAIFYPDPDVLIGIIR